jgi:hypothetical protein
LSRNANANYLVVADKHSVTGRLEQLLVTFSDAKCKEPKDKIYGLLGLAIDCLDEPIKVDYNKPVFQLFEETIRFHAQCKPLDIAKPCHPKHIDRSMRLMWFSGLVQKMLKEALFPETFQLSNIKLSKYSKHSKKLVLTRRPRSSSPSTFTFSARGLIVATILHAGPDVHEIAASDTANKEWKQSFVRHYSTSTDLERILQLDEKFQDTLLDMIDHNNSGQLSAKYGPFDTDYASAELCDEFWLTGEPRPRPKEARILILKEPKLESPKRSRHNPQLFLANNFMMGMATPRVRAGDLICSFWNSTVTAVLRPLGAQGPFKVVGRAMFASPAKWDEKASDTDYVVHLHLDIDTIHALSWDEDS